MLYLTRVQSLDNMHHCLYTYPVTYSKMIGATIFPMVMIVNYVRSWRNAYHTGTLPCTKIKWRLDVHEWTLLAWQLFRFFIVDTGTLTRFTRTRFTRTVYLSKLNFPFSVLLLCAGPAPVRSRPKFVIVISFSDAYPNHHRATMSPTDFWRPDWCRGLRSIPGGQFCTGNSKFNRKYFALFMYDIQI